MINLENTKEFKNILFIGDPHISSIQISKRQDDIHTLDTVIDKMRQAAKISHEHQCYTCIEGDLFDNDKEKDITTLNKTIEVLQEFYYPPMSIIGNHEKTENELTQSNMLYTLIQAGIINTIEDNHVSIRLNVDGQKVFIGGTNYGSNIPSKIKRPKDADKVIWMTHHDLIFQEYYPNAQPLKEIIGVDLAVNGHMHGTQKQVQTKTTTWWNTGNILRQKTDMENHIPSVWLWNPIEHDKKKEKLTQIPLKYKKDIFKKVEIIEPSITQNYDLGQFNDADNKLKFIELIHTATTAHDNNKTSDKDLVKEHMENLMNIQNIPEDIRAELFEMLETTLD